MLSVRFFACASALSLSAWMLSLHPAAAQTPAIGFATGATGLEDNAANAGVSSFSLGFEFTAKSPILVTSLGYFNDPRFDPTTPTFSTPHQVGLYQVVPGVGGSPETGLLLAQALVASSDVSQGNFLYHSLTTPVLLAAGGDYVLAGVSGPTDPYFFGVQDSGGNAALTVDPTLTYGQDRSVVSTTLAFPTDTDSLSEPGFFGPNFLSSPVPETSTTLSLGLMLGLAGLGLAARRRSH